jgi:ribosomal protein L36
VEEEEARLVRRRGVEEEVAWWGALVEEARLVRRRGVEEEVACCGGRWW